MTKGWIYFYGFFTGFDFATMLDAFTKGQFIWGIFFTLMFAFMVFVSVRSLREDEE